MRVVQISFQPGRVRVDDEQAIWTDRERTGERRHAVQTVERYRPLELRHPGTDAGLRGEPRSRVGESGGTARPVSVAGRRSPPTCRRSPAHGRRPRRRTRSRTPAARRRRIPVVAPAARVATDRRRARPSPACCPCPRRRCPMSCSLGRSASTPQAACRQVPPCRPVSRPAPSGDRRSGTPRCR